VIHERAIQESGGSFGVRDLGLVESATAQPSQQAFGVELYPTMAEKASALGFALIQNHAFVDGNKRVGYQAMFIFLQINGFEIIADDDEAEAFVLKIAASEASRDELAAWIVDHIQPAD
jgi:death-on-curing protein